VLQLFIVVHHLDQGHQVRDVVFLSDVETGLRTVGRVSLPVVTMSCSCLLRATARPDVVWELAIEPCRSSLQVPLPSAHALRRLPSFLCPVAMARTRGFPQSHAFSGQGILVTHTHGELGRWCRRAVPRHLERRSRLDSSLAHTGPCTPPLGQISVFLTKPPRTSMQAPKGADPCPICLTCARTHMCEWASTPAQTPQYSPPSPHLVASHPIPSAEGDLPAWAHEHHAKLVHAFVHSHAILSE
jgi:hypothetical protein